MSDQTHCHLHQITALKTKEPTCSGFWILSKYFTNDYLIVTVIYLPAPSWFSLILFNITSIFLFLIISKCKLLAYRCLEPFSSDDFGLHLTSAMFIPETCIFQ